MFGTTTAGLLPWPSPTAWSPEGRLGRIYHVRAAYLQSWAGPNSPLTWRFQKNQAGSGSLGDLMSHIIDMARFVTGDEISEVGGAIEKRFIKQRPRLGDSARKGTQLGGRYGSFRGPFPGRGSGIV